MAKEFLLAPYLKLLEVQGHKMQPGLFRDRVQIQHRTVVHKATGVDETWVIVETRAARVIVLDPRARAEYAQITSEVTHIVEFHGHVTLEIRTDRLVWMTGGSSVLELADPPRYTTGRANCTRVAVREVV